MKKYSLLALSLLLFGCSFVTAASSQKPGTSLPVSLEVHIESTDSLLAPCAICSDSFGPYIDGQSGVSAKFGKYGDLVINFQNSGAIRTVNFTYNPAGTNLPPPAIPVIAPKTYTYKAFDPYVNLQDMTLGMSQCVGMTWNYTDGGSTTRTHGFRFNQGNLTQTGYAVFTCTAADVDGRCTTWEAEPKESACNPPANVSIARVRDSVAVHGKTTNTDYGLFHMPYKMTLIRR
jgi:hypothetical protein